MKIPATRIVVRKSGNSRREMTRSAPPARTSTKVSSKSRSSDTLSISIDDIYQSAERERLNYSAHCRRQNLEHAQSQFQFFRESTRSPSRPNTSASKYMYINSSRKDIYTPVSVWSEPVLSRPNSIMRHTTDLAELDEYEIEEDEDYAMSEHFMPISVTVSPVSRDCCEIIGPQMCAECRKNRIRQLGRESSNSLFPTLQPSEENLTTTAIAKKYLPGLSYSDIEDKLARGQIAKPSFLKKKQERATESKSKTLARRVTILDIKDSSATEDKESTKSGDNDTKSDEKVKPESLYFANIRDLNHKIISGAARRSVGSKSMSKEELQKPKKTASPTNFYPTFVSPRKANASEEPKYKAYYEPPLVAKESQSVEPAFFAGSASNYQLPEKLPDELVFVDKEGKQQKISNTRRISSQLSIYSDSTIQEETVETATPEPGPDPRDTIQEEL